MTTRPVRLRSIPRVTAQATLSGRLDCDHADRISCAYQRRSFNLLPRSSGCAKMQMPEVTDALGLIAMAMSDRMRRPFSNWFVAKPQRRSTTSK